MLKAKHPNNGFQIAEEIEDIDPYPVDWHCPVCEEPVHYVKRSVDGRIAHFRHEAGDGKKHPGASESMRHEKIKLKLYKYWSMMPYTRYAQIEHHLGDRIADITMIHKEHGKIAVEVQLSLQNADEFEDRTKDLNSEGYAVLWLVDLDKFGHPIIVSAPTPTRKGEIVKWLQSNYYGRYYAVDYSLDPNIESDKPQPKILPCRLDYWNNSPELTTGKLSNAEPFVPDGSRDLNIARFYDKKWWG